LVGKTWPPVWVLRPWAFEIDSPMVSEEGRGEPKDSEQDRFSAQQREHPFRQSPIRQRL
jgi:hypothetical protein